MNRKTGYTKLDILVGLSLILILLLSLPKAVAAQEPLPDLRLLAWSPDGAFLLATTPGQTATLPDNSVRQLQTLWRLSPDGSTRQQLAEGFGPQLSPDGRLVTFTRLAPPNQLSQWSIDVATGELQPLDAGLLSVPDITVAGDPSGQVYVSPNGKKRAILVNQFFNAALWVGAENAPAQLVLNSDGEVFSDLTWRPDGEALALIRTPLGSQTDTSGELLRIDLLDNSATRLSQNNAVDRSPVWSADGTTLAVVRNQQLTLVPANQLMVQEFAQSQPSPALPSSSPIGILAQFVPPATIRVIHHASNTCRNVPVDQIDTIPFEEYVKRVVPYEVYPSWPAETLKAQAVAARTYGWSKYLQNPNGAYHVTDWINHQYMCDNMFASTSQAVDDTAGEYLAYNGQIIVAMCSAENSSPTKTSPYVAYLQAIDDPVSFGQPLNGHGYGMGQWGAQRWADQYNWSYQAILRHYYTDVTLEEAGKEIGGATDTTPPNVSLAAPWSNYYITGNKLQLLVNASDDSGIIAQTNVYLSTPWATSLILSEAGPANPAGYVVDVSTWTDQTLVANTLVLTAEAFDPIGRRGVSPPVTIGLDRIAPTARLTITTIPTGATTVIVASPTLSLTLAASDATAGVTQIALGQTEWEWQGESLSQEQVGGQPVGQMVNDAGALNGLAMQATVSGDPAGSWSGAEITLPAPKQYRAYFRVKTSDNSGPDEVARLEVIDNQSGAVIGLRRLYGPDFRAPATYQEFYVDFDYQTAVPVILRLTFQDKADIWLDRIIVVDYPIPFTTSPTYNQTRFRLKVIDGAGNVSDDLLVQPTLQTNYSTFLPIVVKSSERIDLD